jgi:hypothetical protein
MNLLGNFKVRKVLHHKAKRLPQENFLSNFIEKVLK